ncbi:MAG: nucleotidyltransferase domain-containing protein [Anaerolineae bacterium]|nr:nucleotidyltransferase domain-containing protein [Thermoflexales bacterium]MDW8395925.1 nucleotidyltransferase domain-containing protein [Anaerolineae bacterium]
MLQAEAIREIVAKVVQRFEPKRVILFGSYAYGTPHEGSDLDLLVVLDKVPPQEERIKAVLELSASSPVSLQIVFMQTDAFEETKDVVGGLAYPAHHQGRVLYEADSRTGRVGIYS